MTELFLKIIGILLIAAVSSVLLRGYRSEFAFLLSLSASVVVLLVLINGIAPFIDYLREFFAAGDIDLSYFTVVLKALAISYIATFAADTCRDFGQSALALKAELAGRCAIFVLSLPLIKNVLATALGFAKL